MDIWVGLAGVLAATSVGLMALLLRPRAGRMRDLASAKMLLTIAAPDFRPHEGLLSETGDAALFEDPGQKKLAYLELQNGAPRVQLIPVKEIQSVRHAPTRAGRAALIILSEDARARSYRLQAPPDAAAAWARRIEAMRIQHQYPVN